MESTLIVSLKNHQDQEKLFSCLADTFWVHKIAAQNHYPVCPSYLVIAKIVSNFSTQQELSDFLLDVFSQNRIKYFTYFVSDTITTTSIEIVENKSNVKKRKLKVPYLKLVSLNSSGKEE